MSLDLEARLRAYLVSSPQTLHIIPTLEVSHPAMSHAYYLWREPVAGTITTEDGLRTVQCLNFEVRLAGTERNLDQNFEVRIDLTDRADEFREQLDLIPLGTTDLIRVVYREYLSDDLGDMLVRAVLQVESVSYEVGVAVFAAVSPRYNTTSSGELYTTRDVPMIRGFL